MWTNGKKSLLEAESLLLELVAIICQSMCLWVKMKLERFLWERRVEMVSQFARHKLVMSVQCVENSSEQKLIEGFFKCLVLSITIKYKLKSCRSSQNFPGSTSANGAGIIGLAWTSRISQEKKKKFQILFCLHHKHIFYFTFIIIKKKWNSIYFK